MVGLAAMLSASILTFASNSTSADPASDVARCKAIKPNAARLQCFDAINAPADQPATVSAYRKMDIVDLQLDYQKLLSQKIEVAGDGMMFMGALMLTKSRGASEPMPVNISKASRDSQKAIISQCGNAYCPVVVRGTVGGNVNGLPAITADEIEIQ